MPSPSFAKNLEARDVHKTRRAKGARLVWLARVATFASCAMLFWVAFLPGSCSPFAARTRARETHASFLTTAGRIVPKTLITKYAVEEKNGGRLACVTHVLPSAAWSALAPFQLGAFFFPKVKKAIASLRVRLAHRVAGFVLFAVSLTMSFGYVFAIHRNGLHFHKHDFPSVAHDEAFSVFSPLAKAWFVAGGSDAFEAFEHACALWFCATATKAVFVAARGNRTRESFPGNARGRGWVRVHRAWAIRHLAAGYSVAAQRAFVATFHVSCSVLYAERVCASPAAQKGIFADALVLGTALCVAAGEAAIRDADALDEHGGKRE